MIFEVFRQGEHGSDHMHCGHVHAPDRELAMLFAEIQFARREDPERVWLVSRDDILERAKDTRTFGEGTVRPRAFGGATDKSYRMATAYANLDRESPGGPAGE